MASQPLRPCRHPGCNALVPGGYCPAHRLRREDRRSEEARSWRWMYGTEEWRHLRSGQLLAEPFCRECARRGLRTRATDVDHIRDHKGDWAIFADPGNLESLCHGCHSRKTARDLWESKTKRRHV